MARALVHIDAGVLIGFLDAGDAHHDAARIALEGVLRAGDRIEMAASAFAECLVGPARRGADGVDIVRALVERVPIVIVPLDEEIAVGAAVVRAAHPKLRLPDALVVATAGERGADQLITTDRRWPSARALKLGAEIVGL
jgi:predicted nucleic acid-binding protein